MKLAFVYDRMNKIGGAERVLTTLHEMWPEAPWYTAVYDKKGAAWADGWDVRSSFLQKIPYAASHHELLPTLTPYAFESFDLSAYDVIISVTSADAKAVITSPRQLHICYLLTPTRYLWSHKELYQGKGLLSSFKNMFMRRLQRWDKVASSRPDIYVSISQEVARRCETYYHRQPEQVVYPPVDTQKFTVQKPTHSTSSYFLVVSRLVPYKRIDLAINACNKLGERLVVVGSGSLKRQLKSIAGPTIEFVGQVDDETLARYYQQAQALLFPQEEEFGITAIEAQAAGIPVIAFSKGSAPEIIKHGETGVLFSEQTVDSLVEAIASFKNHTWYDKTIQEHARTFDTSVFRDTFRNFVEVAWKKHQFRE